VDDVKLSDKPDEHMRWIYDHRHRDHHSPMAQYLRARRVEALRNAPEWMRLEAMMNDALLYHDEAPKNG
jgi:hypothetical protein